MPQPKDLIGPYTLLRRLGHGGFGEVWLAERQSSLLTVQVALKLPLRSTHDADIIRNEARIWLRASGHPNVVPVLAAEEYDGQIVIACEYVAGGSLAGWLCENGGAAAKSDDAVRIIEGILAGLAHLNGAGIVHRDLKPENVLLQGGIPRLTDFGLSRTLGGTNLTENLSGSPRYMAPETFRGAYSPASDLWTVGVLFYEMLTGATPFRSPDIMELITAVQQQEPPPLPDAVTDELRVVVARLLEKRPEDRYGSAQEALEELRAAASASGRPGGRDKQAIGSPSATPTPHWHVELFGHLRAVTAGRTLTKFRTRHAAELLARLAYRPGEPVGREALMEMLWPDQPPESMRNRLNVELSGLRQQLELKDLPGKEIVIGVDPVLLSSAIVSSDAARMEALLGAARSCGSLSERAGLLQEAFALYCGPLLPGYEAPWVAAARHACTKLYIAVTEQLIAALRAVSDLEGAVTVAAHCVERALLEEEAHALLVYSLINADRPCDAQRKYDEMVKLWEAEYGVPPSNRARLFGAEAKRRCEAKPALLHTPVIPQVFTAMVGREKEMDDLRECLGEPETRLVTLLGAGGNGKTRLAIEAAREQAPSLNGAVWFLPLADLTETPAIVDSLHNVLNLAVAADADTRAQIIEKLSAQPCLLVIDNFEHLLPDGADLVQILLESAPTLKCLVTSQNSLRLTMERTLQINPLPVPEPPDSANAQTSPKSAERNPCVRLFLERARRVRSDFAVTSDNASAIVEICRRLDGIPLAIELAASWTKVLTPPQMLTQLGKILVSRERDRALRHRSLDAVIGASWDRLSNDLRQFLARLSVFRGGWTTEEAEDICQMPFALLSLTELQEASLILCEEYGQTMRYRMLEPLREFSEARFVSQSDAGRTLERHRAYFLQLAQQAADGLRGPNEAAWLKHVSEALPNLRAALSASPASQQLRAAAELQRFWIARGHVREGRKWMEEALPALEQLPETSRGGVRLAAGILACAAGEMNRAVAHLNASLAACRSVGDELGTAKALTNLANIASTEGDAGTARQDYESALAVARRLDDPRLTATILGNLGALVEDPCGARGHLQEALALNEGYRNDRQKADILHNLADLDAKEHDYRAAVRNLILSIEIRQRFADRSRVPQALLVLADLATKLAKFEAAIRLLGAADRAYAELSVSPSSNEKTQFAQCLEVSRDQISPYGFEAEWTAGRRMLIDDAIGFALGTAREWE